MHTAAHLPVLQMSLCHIRSKHWRRCNHSPVCDLNSEGDRWLRLHKTARAGTVFILIRNTLNRVYTLYLNIFIKCIQSAGAGDVADDDDDDDVGVVVVFYADENVNPGAGSPVSCFSSGAKSTGECQTDTILICSLITI